MKRILVLILALGLAAGGFAQALSFSEFQSAFTSFADSLAGGLNLNSTLGNAWSDSYIGGFPHLGAGLLVGSTFAGQGATEELFSVFGETPPTGLEKLGVPVPAVGGSFKIGLPFIPLDIGLKGGLIPASTSASLESLTGVQAEYKNAGISLRYALVKERLLLPDVSLGLSANYLAGKIAAPVGSSQSLTYDDNTLTFTQPMLDLEWETKTLDATLQISKTLLFIRPYAGLGYTIGSSTVRGGLNSAMSYTPGSMSEEEFMAYLESQGYSFSSTGFLYEVTNTDPTFRVYGGVSMSLLLTLDAQVLYVPATKNLGAMLSARIQL